MSSPDITIGVIQKTAGVQVRVTFTPWRGQTKLHLREYHPGPVPGDWWPSKIGVCIDVARLPELVRNTDRRAQGERSQMERQVTWTPKN
jgi:hypothetical protein